MKCPKCGSYNATGATECDKCGVILAHVQRSAPEPSVSLCAWTESGRPCPCRGILTLATNGGGQWYCREHWERLSHREPYAKGNGLPVMGQSLAAKKWHQEMAEYRQRMGLVPWERRHEGKKPEPVPLAKEVA